MSENTKTCPFCGEEIMETAKKCKHCGEWLDKQGKEDPQVIQCPACGEDISSSATVCEHCGEVLGKFANLDVNNKWKKRFEVVEKQVINGITWKYQPAFKSMPVQERLKLAKELWLSDIPSTLAIVFFNFFYYLAKGMWQKALVYMLVFWITVPLLGSFSLVLYFALFIGLCPYDYYRLKVLKKQW